MAASWAALKYGITNSQKIGSHIKLLVNLNMTNIVKNSNRLSNKSKKSFNGMTVKVTLFWKIQSYITIKQ